MLDDSVMARIRLSPPRGTMTSMYWLCLSSTCTASRSAVGMSWIAAAGKPGRCRGLGEHRGDRRVGGQRFRATLEHDGIPGLQAQRRGVGGDVGTRLVDDRRRRRAGCAPGRSPDRWAGATARSSRRPDREGAATSSSPSPSPRRAPRSASAGRAAQWTGRRRGRAARPRRWRRAHAARWLRRRAAASRKQRFLVSVDAVASARAACRAARHISMTVSLHAHAARRYKITTHRQRGPPRCGALSHSRCLAPASAPR